MKPLSATSLFWQLIRYRDRIKDWSTLGSWLQRQVVSCTFPESILVPSEIGTYTRTRIAQETSSSPHQFESLILRWDRDAQTPIHGHPTFSFYYVIKGIFRMELFTQTTQGPQLEGTQLFYPSNVTWFLGQQGYYDNFIHRITCLKPGLTFHVYSGDARKGATYESAALVHEPAQFKIFSGR